MVKILVMICSTVGSAIGWWLGEDFGIMTAFMLGVIGMAVGVWAGRRLATRWSL